MPSNEFPELSQQTVCGTLLLLKVKPWHQYNLCLKVFISFPAYSGGHFWKSVEEPKIL